MPGICIALNYCSEYDGRIHTQMFKTSGNSGMHQRKTPGKLDMTNTVLQNL